jgi:Uma2 family endonuclease
VNDPALHGLVRSRHLATFLAETERTDAAPLPKDVVDTCAAPARASCYPVAMVAAAPLRPPLPAASAEDADQRVILHGVSWERYEALLALLGDDFPGLRVTYLEGALELTSPSRNHEAIKTTFARLIETYAMEMEIELEGYGSTTFRKRAKERGAEPDECYTVGVMGEVPDIAFEVVWTSGGLDKLTVYQGLGVPEVWFWKAGAITLHHLGPDGDEEVSKSRFLPELDVAELVRFPDLPTQTRAARTHRDALRARRAG